MRCGVSDNDWFDLCNKKDDVYACCKPIPIMQEFMKRLKERNIEIFVLTHDTNSGSYFNKIDFVLKHYPAINSYRQILFVNKTADKIKMLKTYCSKCKTMPSEVLLIEDTYDTCLIANGEGFAVKHISEFLI